MRFLISKAIYHLSFFEKAKKEGVLDLNFENFFEGICSIFCLTDEERAEILNAFKNEDFAEISTADIAKFHLYFLENIQCKKTFFGSECHEKELLKSKRDALDYFEKLKASDMDLISAFEKNIGNKYVAFSFSLYWFLNYGVITDQLLSQLRKNATAKANCDYDTLIFLMSIDKTNLLQYKNILKKSNFKLYNVDYNRILEKVFDDRGMDDGNT